MVYTLVDVISLVSKVYSFLILGRVILSWVHLDPDNPLVQIVYRLTEPVMRPVRNLLPTMGGFDFSPIIVLIGLQVLTEIVIRLLLQSAA